MGDFNTIMMQTGLTYDQYMNRSFYGEAEQVEAEIMAGLDKYKLKDMGVSDKLIMSKLSPVERFRYIAVNMFKERKKFGPQLLVSESVWKQLDNFAKTTTSKIYNYKAEVMLIAAAYIDHIINQSFRVEWFEKAYEWVQFSATQFDILRYSRFLILNKYIKDMTEVNFLQQASNFNITTSKNVVCNPYTTLPIEQAIPTKQIKVVVKSTSLPMAKKKAQVIRKGTKQKQVETVQETVEDTAEETTYTLPLYKFDSLLTIHERLCVQLNQNISVLVFDSEVSIHQQENQMVQYNDTDIEFQTADKWSYNQYENKQLVFRLLLTVEQLEELLSLNNVYDTEAIKNYIYTEQQSLQAAEKENAGLRVQKPMKPSEILRERQLELEKLKAKQVIYQNKMIVFSRWLLKQVELVREDVFKKKLKALVDLRRQQTVEELVESEDEEQEEDYNMLIQDTYEEDDEFAQLIAKELEQFGGKDPRSPARTPVQLTPLQAHELQNLQHKRVINLSDSLSFMANPIQSSEHFVKVVEYLMDTFTEFGEDEAEWVQFIITVLQPTVQDHPELYDFMKVVFIQDEEMIGLIAKHESTTATLKTYQQLLYEFDADPNPKHRIVDLYQTLYELKGQFSLPKTDVYQIFNDLAVNVLVPYARAGNFVKVVNSIELPRTQEADKWNADYALTSKDLMFYVSTVESPTVVNGKFEEQNEFVKVFIRELPDQLVSDRTQFELSIEITNEELEQAIYQRVIDIIQPKIQYMKVSRKFSKGLTLISGNYTLNPFFFHEMAQNNNILNQAINLKEIKVLYPKLRTLMRYQVAMNPEEVDNRINVNMNLTKIDVGTFLLSDPVFTHFNLTSGDKAWLLYITASIDFSMVQSLIMKLQLALNYLQKHAQAWIVNYYCYLSFSSTKFITSNEIDYKSSINESNTQSFKNVAREIFVSGYARLCYAKNSLQQVKVLTDQEVQDYYNKAYTNKTYNGVLKGVKANPGSYMVFPNPAALPGDANVKRYLMSCPTNSENKYIGIKRNNRLSNKDKYPFVPCCYKNADTTSATAIYNTNQYSFDYIADLPSKVDTTKVYTGKLIMRPNQVGQLPQRLENMLLLAEGSKDSLTKQVRYLRLGVADPTRDYNLVFIQAIRRALGLSTKVTDEDLQQLYEQVQKGALTSTGMNKHVAEQILSQGGYLDPRFWLPAAREVYGTEILLLSQDKKTNPKGSVVCEYFNRFRIVNLGHKQYERCVILFVHNISEWEDLSTPIIEVVVRVKESQFRDTIDNAHCFATYETDEVQACFFDGDGDTGKSRLISTMFDLIDRMYPTHKISLNFENEYILDQSDDVYNKTRAVWLGEYVENSNEVVPIPCIHTDPICTLVQTYTSEEPTENFVANTIQEADLILDYKFGVAQGTAQVVVYKGQVVGVYVQVTNQIHPTNLRSVDNIKPVGVYIGVVATKFTEEMMPRKFNLSHQSYPQIIQIAGNLKAFNERYKQISKQAMMLKAYMYYVFSHNYPTALPEDVNKFFETSISVSEEYDIVPEEEIYKRSLSTDNEWFILLTVRTVSKMVDGKKLRLEKPWMKLKLSASIPNWMYVLQRLKFNLMLDLKNNPDMIKQYKNNRVVPNFYESSDEFKPSKHYTVYNTPDEYEQALHQLDQTYYVYTNLTVQEQAFYVQFRYENQVLTRLAVPTDSLAQAIKITQEYPKSGSVYVGEVDENASEPENLVLLDDELKVQVQTKSPLSPLMIGVLKYELVEEEDKPEEELQAIVDTSVQVKYFALVEPSI